MRCEQRKVVLWLRRFQEPTWHDDIEHWPERYRARLPRDGYEHNRVLRGVLQDACRGRASLVTLADASVGGGPATTVPAGCAGAVLGVIVATLLYASGMGFAASEWTLTRTGSMNLAFFALGLPLAVGACMPWLCKVLYKHSCHRKRPTIKLSAVWRDQVRRAVRRARSGENVVVLGASSDLWESVVDGLVELVDCVVMDVTLGLTSSMDREIDIVRNRHAEERLLLISAESTHDREILHLPIDRNGEESSRMLADRIDRLPKRDVERLSVR